jgi:hypothetical protein
MAAYRTRLSGCRADSGASGRGRCSWARSRLIRNRQIEAMI